jgi:hypothetical protein
MSAEAVRVWDACAEQAIASFSQEERGQIQMDTWSKYLAPESSTHTPPQPLSALVLNQSLGQREFPNSSARIRTGEEQREQVKRYRR